MFLLDFEMIRSKKMISVGLIAKVNLIFGWKALKSWMNVFSSSLVWFQIIRISSM